LLVCHVNVRPMFVCQFLIYLVFVRLALFCQALVGKLLIC